MPQVQGVFTFPLTYKGTACNLTLWILMTVIFHKRLCELASLVQRISRCLLAYKRRSNENRRRLEVFSSVQNTEQ